MTNTAISKRVSTAVLLSVLLACGTIKAQIWETIEMTFPQGDTLLDNIAISFATKNTGWIVSDGDVNSGKPPSQPETRIFKTMDGGHHWSLQKKFDDFLWMSSVVAFDSLHCCAIGGPSGTGVMLSTSDGGGVWTQSNIVDPGGDYFTSLFFWDVHSGIAFNTHRWFTTDGGQSWSKGGDMGKAFPIPSDVSFVNGRFGWIVSFATPYSSDAGYIAHTTDSGITWNYQDSVTAVLSAVDFVDSLRGFAVGSNFTGGTGFVYSTTDGGNLWTWRQFIGSGPFEDIGFLDHKTGWITNVGKMLRTTDGGVTWETQLQGLHTELRKVIIVKKDNVAYAIGDSHFQPPFTLLYADLSGLTSITNGERIEAKEYQLSQNYPNPFNPSTEISYQLPVSSQVTLRIYDLLGREVAEIVNPVEGPGKYTVHWNASRLASGVYFYRLQAGDFVETKRLLLLR